MLLSSSRWCCAFATQGGAAASLEDGRSHANGRPGENESLDSVVTVESEATDQVLRSVSIPYLENAEPDV
jgi:hypothetical protein